MSVSSANIIPINNNNNNNNNKMNPNLCRTATEEDLNLNEEAINLSLELFRTPFNPFLSLFHFKCIRNEKDFKKKNLAIEDFLRHLNDLKLEREKSVKRRSKTLKKYFNTSLNKLNSILTPDSSLRFLLPVDDQLNFMKKRIPTERKHVDFYDYEQKIIKGNSPKEGYVYHPIGGGRAVFDSAEHFLSALKAGIDKCTDWSFIKDSSVLISEKMLSFPVDSGNLELNVALKIPLVGTDFWDFSDSTRIAHILCNGVPPIMVKGKFKITFKKKIFKDIYPVYAEYLGLVKEKIINIINESHNVPECPYRVIPCCRTEPYTCNSRNIALSIKTKQLTCHECKMDLCSAGCGCVYHGEYPCGSTFDEVSEEYIANMKKCPNCDVPTEKTEGCNHMSCRCGTQWCWICCRELPKDQYGHYSTVLHFRQDVNGIGVEGGCNQFLT